MPGNTGFVVRRPFALGLLFGAGALTAYLGLRALQLVAGILVLVILAAFLAVGLHRATAPLRRRGVSDRILVLGTIASITLIVTVGCFTFLPAMFTQIKDLVRDLGGYLDELQSTSAGSDLENNYQLISNLRDFLTPKRLQTLATGLLGGLGAALGLLFSGVTVVILTLYFLTGFDRIKSNALRLTPASRRERAAALGEQILGKLGAYLVGAVLVASCAGTAAFFFMWIAGIPHPLALALVVALFDLIPQIGATIGSSIVVLIALTVSLPTALVALGFFMTYQGLENWFIYPRAMSKTVHVSNLAAIISVLIGGALAGVVGILLAVPLCAALGVIFRELVVPAQDSR